MEASLAVFQTSRIKASSDLGAAGIGAAVCESARYGGFGAEVYLSEVPLKAKDITPEEILICETQARMAFQVSPESVVEVMKAIQSKGGIAVVIGEITADDQYERIAIDTLLMAANDVIAQGAMPIVYTDEVTGGDSEWFTNKKRSLGQKYHLCFSLCESLE